MEKPEAFIAGIAVGGLLLGAGYMAGRHALSSPQPPPETGADEDHAPPRPAATARRGRHKPPKQEVPLIVGVTASSAAPPAGAVIQTGEALEVHAGPDEGSPVTGTVPIYAQVRVLEAGEDGWTVVSRPDDRAATLGWVLWRGTAPAPRRVAGVFGTATIRGVVHFTGRPPVMAVPKKRRDTDVCKDKDVKYNAVVVDGGGLEGVFVRIANDAVQGSYDPPPAHATIDQIDCMYVPRIQGVVGGQTIDIGNRDGTLHNVHTYRGVESWFNRPHVKGSPPIEQPMPDAPGIVKLTCDVHPWMRGFVVVSAHPFFAVTGAGGSFAIEHVPPGRYPVEAWHPRYGLKETRVEVGADGAVEVAFSYDGTEPEPAENRDELKDLF
jgi:plastocyanin